MNPEVTCRELVEFLDDYLAGALSPERVQAFNLHLSACPSCVAYMKTYDRARLLAQQALRDGAPVPSEVPEELVQAILAARDTDRS